MSLPKHYFSPLLLLLLGLPCRADWPGFRGPLGNGVSAEAGLPTSWGEKENLLWKVHLPGPGSSSPIVLGEKVFLTCWSGYGDGKARPGDQANLKRHLVCLDRATGKTLWQVDVAAKLPELEWTGPILQHGYTTSTPLTDGERLYVQFGKSGVFAYDLSGKELWRADVGSLLNSFGSGASPALFGNLLIVNATVESSRLIALDKKSGKVAWRVRINGDCWTMPVLVQLAGGKTELVLFGRAVVYGFDPENGQALWECECIGPDYVSASPLVRGDVVYVMGAGNKGRVCQAIRAGGRGDVTKTHLVWKQKVGASFTSPILVGDYLYFFSTLATCLRADTGAIVYQERLSGLGTEYASPVAADGKIFLFTRRGEGHVMAAKGTWEPLKKNVLDAPGGFTASPAISRGQIFVRANDVVYCLGQRVPQ